MCLRVFRHNNTANFNWLWTRIPLRDHTFPYKLYGRPWIWFHGFHTFIWGVVTQWNPRSKLIEISCNYKKILYRVAKFSYTHKFNRTPALIKPKNCRAFYRYIGCNKTWCVIVYSVLLNINIIFQVKMYTWQWCCHSIIIILSYWCRHILQPCCRLYNHHGHDIHCELENLWIFGRCKILGHGVQKCTICENFICDILENKHFVNKIPVYRFSCDLLYGILYGIRIS